MAFFLPLKCEGRARDNIRILRKSIVTSKNGPSYKLFAFINQPYRVQSFTRKVIFWSEYFRLFFSRSHISVCMYYFGRVSENVPLGIKKKFVWNFYHYFLSHEIPKNKKNETVKSLRFQEEEKFLFEPTWMVVSSKWRRTCSFFVFFAIFSSHFKENFVSRERNIFICV